MKFEDAVLLLGDDFDKFDFSRNRMFSKSLGKWLVKSKYGLCQCGSDWPFPYYENPKDKEVEDWEVIDSLNKPLLYY